MASPPPWQQCTPPVCGRRDEQLGGCGQTVPNIVANRRVWPGARGAPASYGVVKRRAQTAAQAGEWPAGPGPVSGARVPLDGPGNVRNAGRAGSAPTRFAPAQISTRGSQSRLRTQNRCCRIQVRVERPNDRRSDRRRRESQGESRVVGAASVLPKTPKRPRSHADLTRRTPAVPRPAPQLATGKKTGNLSTRPSRQRTRPRPGYRRLPYNSRVACASRGCVPP
jgi:hypothetical protein